jgi:hypothetical protein
MLPRVQISIVSFEFSFNIVKFVKPAIKMERRIMFEAFERVFETKLSNEKSREESFEEATTEYRQQFGFDPYKNVGSFMASRSRSRKQKRLHS